MATVIPSLHALPGDLSLEADRSGRGATQRRTRHDVAVLVPGEVVRAGLESVLRRIPTVDNIGTVRPDSLRADLASGGYHALIIAFEQWHLLAGIQDGPDRELPAILVLGDNPYENCQDAFASLPSDGFLSLADLSARGLEDALARSIAGELPMPAALARQLLAMHRIPLPAARPRASSLTPRETETLLLMANGMSNKQIARALTISPHGAKRLVGSVLAKFDAPNRTAAVMSAIGAGLV